MKKKHHVFICHFNDRYRDYLRLILADFQNVIQVVGECKEFPCCMEWLENDTENVTDCVLISLPHRIDDPAKIIKTLTSEFNRVKFVTMSPFEVESLSEIYLKAGASRHFGSKDQIDDLIDSIIN